MSFDPATFQLPVTFALFGLFAYWEQRRPLNAQLERRRDLAQDCLAVTVILATSLLARGLFTRLFAWQGPGWLREWPSVARMGIALFLIDFALYGIHRLLHHRYFWRTHAWHHSTRELYWFSGYRSSVIQATLIILPTIFVSLALLRFTPGEFLFLHGTAAFFQLINHANVRTDWRYLSQIIVTPEYHRLHHDRGEIRDKNFGAIFTLWDRVFGTYLDPAAYPEPRPVGLDDFERPDARTMIGF